MKTYGHWVLLNSVHARTWNASTLICFALATQCIRLHGKAWSSVTAFCTKFSQDKDSTQRQVRLMLHFNPKLLYIKIISKNAVTPTTYISVVGQYIIISYCNFRVNVLLQCKRVMTLRLSELKAVTVKRE